MRIRTIETKCQFAPMLDSDAVLVAKEMTLSAISSGDLRAASISIVSANFTATSVFAEACPIRDNGQDALAESLRRTNLEQGTLALAFAGRHYEDD